jgi:hypothetical protein
MARKRQSNKSPPREPVPADAWFFDTMKGARHMLGVQLSYIARSTKWDIEAIREKAKHEQKDLAARASAEIKRVRQRRDEQLRQVKREILAKWRKRLSKLSPEYKKAAKRKPSPV